MTVQFSIDPTPNPNSLKITVSTVLSAGPMTFQSPAEAEKNELVKKLFTIPGLRSIFVINNFATVTKDPATSWDEIEPKLREVVEGHFQGK
jgi:hypothetical protein